MRTPVKDPITNQVIAHKPTIVVVDCNCFVYFEDTYTAGMFLENNQDKFITAHVIRHEEEDEE